VLGAQQPFRPEADRKVIILITDAPPKIPDKDTPSIDDAVRALREHKITFLYMIVNHEDAFRQIQKASGLPGDILPLVDAVTGKVEFDRLLPEIARKVSKSSS
jgi:Ca-activated chloride channel family protein